MVPFDVVKLSFEAVTLLSKRMEGGVTVSNEFDKRQTARAVSFFSYECCAAQHYEHKWWNRESTVKCRLKCYVKPMKDPLGVSPSKGNQGTTRRKEKTVLTSVGIEPMTSGLDLPLHCRLSYEVGQRKSGTIQVVNRGEEKLKFTLQS